MAPARKFTTNNNGTPLRRSSRLNPLTRMVPTSSVLTPSSSSLTPPASCPSTFLPSPVENTIELQIGARDQALDGDDSRTTLEQAQNLRLAVDPDLEKKAEKSLWVILKVSKWQRVTRDGGKQAAETRAARGRTSTLQRKRKATTKSGTNVQMSTPPDSPTEDDVASQFVSPPQKKRRLIAKSSTNAQVQPVQDKRPVSIGKPPVCAENRHELCETLPYYNSRQSAACILHDYVRGMMLDNDVGGHSYMDEEVVFARGGGCCGDDGNGGKTQTKDHDPNSAEIRAFVNNMTEKMPLNVIVGNDNTKCPSTIPHKYCVMDSFHVTDVWSVKLNGMVTFYYRLEKINLSRKSWWAPVNTPDPPADRDFTTKAVRQVCGECGQKSPQVHTQGWICLNSACIAFWILNGGEVPAELEYNPVFINERTEFDGFLPSYALRPELPQPGQSAKDYSVSRASTKGIVCPDCNRCIARQNFDYWECKTKDCGFIYRLPREPVSAASLMGNINDSYEGHAYPEDKVRSTHIGLEVKKVGLFRSHTYRLPPSNSITHMFSNATINKAPGGPDDLLWNLQLGENDLRRSALKMAQVDGQLSAHFSVNYGLPYKYIVAVDSKGFNQAPPEVLEAVRRMTWAAEQAVSDNSFQRFNECLMVAYMESEKMGYHDDGEDTLEPVVATLSLGAPGTMRFRMKLRYFSGFSDKQRTRYDPKTPIIDGCWKPEERRRLNELARTGISSQALNDEAKRVLKCKGTPALAPALLELRLKHGDLLVMNGADLQKYYEHEAMPMEGLRFCLTCRGIKRDMLPEDQLWKGDLPEGFDLPENQYHGDTERYEEVLKKMRA